MGGNSLPNEAINPALPTFDTGKNVFISGTNGSLVREFQYMCVLVVHMLSPSKKKKKTATNTLASVIYLFHIVNRRHHKAVKSVDLHAVYSGIGILKK